MRYQDTGEVHKDFHLATNRTVSYIMEHYGEGFLRTLCKRTSQQVYCDIYQKLKNGNISALTEHWKYYYTRENGIFELEESQDEAQLRVKRCPAAAHIIDRGEKLSPHYYLFVKLLIEYWVEETPFICDMEIHSSTAYTVRIRRNYASQ